MDDASYVELQADRVQNLKRQFRLCAPKLPDPDPGVIPQIGEIRVAEPYLGEVLFSSLVPPFETRLEVCECFPAGISAFPS